MYPFIMLISSIISLINIALIAYVVINLLISFDIINKHQPIVAKIYYGLQRLIEPLLRPFRKILPEMGGLDISPILLILMLNFLQDALVYYTLGGAAQ